MGNSKSSSDGNILDLDEQEAIYIDSQGIFTPMPYENQGNGIGGSNTGTTTTTRLSMNRFCTFDSETTTSVQQSNQRKKEKQKKERGGFSNIATCLGCISQDQKELRFDCNELNINFEQNKPKGRLTSGSIAYLDQNEVNFFKSSASRNVSAIRFLLKKGVNINILDEERTSPLHVASRLGSVQIVEELLACGADCDITDIAGWTPLHVAAYFSRDAVCMILLKHGAKHSITNRDGQKPLDIATDQKTVEAFMKYALTTTTPCANSTTAATSAYQMCSDNRFEDESNGLHNSKKSLQQSKQQQIDVNHKFEEDSAALQQLKQQQLLMQQHSSPVNNLKSLTTLKVPSNRSLFSQQATGGGGINDPAEQSEDSWKKRRNEILKEYKRNTEHDYSKQQQQQQQFSGDWNASKAVDSMLHNATNQQYIASDNASSRISYFKTSENHISELDFTKPQMLQHQYSQSLQNQSQSQQQQQQSQGQYSHRSYQQSIGATKSHLMLPGGESNDVQSQSSQQYRQQTSSQHQQQQQQLHQAQIPLSMHQDGGGPTPRKLRYQTYFKTLKRKLTTEKSIGAMNPHGGGDSETSQLTINAHYLSNQIIPQSNNFFSVTPVKQYFTQQPSIGANDPPIQPRVLFAESMSGQQQQLFQLQQIADARDPASLRMIKDPFDINSIDTSRTNQFNVNYSKYHSRNHLGIQGTIEEDESNVGFDELDSHTAIIVQDSARLQRIYNSDSSYLVKKQQIKDFLERITTSGGNGGGLGENNLSLQRQHHSLAQINSPTKFAKASQLKFNLSQQQILQHLQEQSEYTGSPNQQPISYVSQNSRKKQVFSPSPSTNSIFYVNRQLISLKNLISFDFENNDNNNKSNTNNNNMDKNPSNSKQQQQSGVFRITQSLLELGVSILNFNPLLGVSFLSLFGQLQTESEDIVRFLIVNPTKAIAGNSESSGGSKWDQQFLLKKSKQATTEILTNLALEENDSILFAYSTYFNFAKMGFCAAMRSFMQDLHLENDPEIIDVLLSCFAKKYYRENQMHSQQFKSADAMHMLSFATVMLDIEMRLERNQEATSTALIAEFYSNISNINEGVEFEEGFIESIIADISANKITQIISKNLIATQKEHYFQLFNLLLHDRAQIFVRLTKFGRNAKTNPDAQFQLFILDNIAIVVNQQQQSNGAIASNTTLPGIQQLQQPFLSKMYIFSMLSLIVSYRNAVLVLRPAVAFGKNFIQMAKYVPEKQGFIVKSKAQLKYQLDNDEEGKLLDQNLRNIYMQQQQVQSSSPNPKVV